MKKFPKYLKLIDGDHKCVVEHIKNGKYYRLAGNWYINVYIDENGKFFTKKEISESLSHKRLFKASKSEYEDSNYGYL